MPVVSEAQIPDLLRALRAGEVIAIPTDTVYGLAAMPTDAAAVRRLADLKGRDAAQPIALLFDSLDALAPLVDDATGLDRVRRHWPGGLTAVVRARRDAGLVPPLVSEAGAVGVRQPDDELARAVIRGCGGVLAVSSANRHGEPPATSAAEVIAVFGEALLVLDGGERHGGAASTVVDLTVEPPVILRAGPVSAEDLGLRPSPL